MQVHGVLWPSPMSKAYVVGQLQLQHCTAGVLAAVAAEIPVIALTVGHPRAKLEMAGATHILDDWFELAELVKSTQV